MKMSHVETVRNSARVRVETNGQPNEAHRIFGDRNFNPLVWMDGYKFSQFPQYPEGMEHLLSYVEARTGAKHNKIPFFLQPFLKEYLTRPLTHAHIDYMVPFLKHYGAIFNEAGYRRVVDEFGGRWPIEIKCLPEGFVTAAGTPQLYVEETHPDFAWLVSPFETAMLRAVWYMASVGAISINMYDILRKSLVETSDLEGEELEGVLSYMLNDFGARGATGHEGAMLGGMAPLLTGFKGSDTTEAVQGLSIYYHNTPGMGGGTIAASEHSTATAFGLDPEEEIAFNDHMIEQFGDLPIFASVIDSVDSSRNVEYHWGAANLDRVMAMKARLVLRPDSGVPEEEIVKILQILWKRFSGDINSKGKRVLNPKVRVIYGDGIDEESIPRIITAVKGAGFSMENVAFGMGGGLLQAVTRDWERYAMKACEINTGKGKRPIGKKPATDPTKTSKFGPRWLYMNAFDEVLVYSQPVVGCTELMSVRYRNGLLLEDYTADEVISLVR